MRSDVVTQTITILVGTMTGTAELVAQEVASVLTRHGYLPLILAMDGARADTFADGGVFLLVSSTYGNGDVPDNAQSFFSDLSSVRPNLTRTVYGIIALGDTTYKATFCHGGLKFDRLLTELGAARVGAPLLHDASSGELAEDLACAWVEEWVSDELAPALAA
jgi:MioC protein